MFLTSYEALIHRIKQLIMNIHLKLCFNILFIYWKIALTIGTIM